MDSLRVHKIKGKVGKDEAWIQKYLADNPELLTTIDLDGIKTELHLIGRELNQIDLLFVDKRGLLTIVETKLFKNPEAKREVVAQVLNYAAELSNLKIHQLCKDIANLKGSIQIKDLVELRKLSTLLYEIDPENESPEKFEKKSGEILAHYAVSGEISIPEEPAPDEERFLKKLEQMMEEGSFRLVIVTDQANEKMLELLNYVNSTMRRGYQLVAFELTKETIRGTDYYIPHLIGSPGLLSAEYYRKDYTGGVRRKWHPEEFLESLPNDLRKDVDQLMELIDNSDDDHFSYHTGTGNKKGELMFDVMMDGKPQTVIGIENTHSNLRVHYRTIKMMNKQQQEKLFSKIQLSFLKPYSTTIKNELKKKRHDRPFMKLIDCGPEGQRAKNLFQFLKDFYSVASSKLS